MSNLKEQKEEIIKRLKAVNEQITDEVIANATKEEMEEYIELIDSIVAKLKTLDILEGNNN